MKDTLKDKIIFCLVVVGVVALFGSGLYFICNIFYNGTIQQQKVVQKIINMKE